MFGLTSCFKEMGAISFNSKQEMLNYVQGVWMYEDEDENKNKNKNENSDKRFIVFKNEEIYIFGMSNYERALGEVYTERISNNEKLKDIKYESIVNDLEEKIFDDLLYVERASADKYDPDNGHYYDIKHKNGEILLDPDTFDMKIVVTEDGIKKGESNASFSDESQYILFKKVEDTPSLNSNTFVALFNSTKDKHIIKPNSFFPKTGTEYAEILKENYPGLENWILYEEGPTTVYSETGSPSSGGLLMYSVSNCIFWKNNQKNAVVYNTYDNTLIIKGDSYFGEDLYKYADWLLGEYPYKLSGSELFYMFRKEAQVSGGDKTFSKTVDNIEYRIDQSVLSGAGVIQIKLVS